MKYNVYCGIAYYLKVIRLKSHNLYEAKEWTEKALEMDDIS